jgi:penicillin-binding protein 2
MPFGTRLRFRERQRLLKDVLIEAQIFGARATQGFVIIFAFILLLISRYVWLQVLRHDELSTRSEANRVKSRPLPPSRGLIYDRNGVLLAENVLEYRLEVVPEQAGDVQKVVVEVGKLITIDAEDRERFEELHRARRRFHSLPLRFHLSEEEVAQFAVNRHRFPGVEVVPYLKRFYPMGADLGHVVGYVGRIGAEDRERLDDPRYSATTHIGKTGIERFYEDVLLGEVGYERVETNAEGRVLRELDRVPPKPGQHLYLSLDANLQRSAIAAFEGRAGVAVAIDPASGEILCMVSQPSFDPNLFVNGISRKDYAALLAAPHQPLFDRTLRGGYEPGSTIKPFYALAGLELGLRHPDDTVFSTGRFQLPGQSQSYGDWRAGGHGRINLRESLAQSVNTYYYQLAADLGIDRSSAYMAQFGFGQLSGIDMNGESGGVLPSREWKQARYGKAWYPGETVIAGIGQGYWVVTPIQLASALATLAGHGVRHRPHLLRATQQSFDAPILPSPLSVPLATVVRDPQNLAAVREGMVAVMHGPTGSARAMGANAPYLIAGKTGTAQRVNRARRAASGGGATPEEVLNRALFVAFAPADAPRIALVVVVEHGDSGSRAAAPVARKILDQYLLGDQAAQYELRIDPRELLDHVEPPGATGAPVPDIEPPDIQPDDPEPPQ